MRKNIFGTINLLLIIGAIIFIIFALNNPQFSFPFSNTITYLIYITYISITIVMGILYFKTKKGGAKQLR